MSENRYFATNEEDTIESERLGYLESCYDPITQSHIQQLGLAHDVTCLEVGAGRGSIARWLAENVSRTGTVTATDTDLKFLADIHARNIEVRQHDITKDTLEKERYDLVHCRFLLMHLNDFQVALQNMAQAVRPGGWLIVEELDYITKIEVNIHDNPGLKRLHEEGERLLTMLQNSGLVDVYFGRNVRALMEGLGVENVGHVGNVPVYHGGELMALFDKMTFLAASRNFDIPDRDKIVEVFSDPNNYFVGPTLFSSWGQKPTV